MTSYLNHLFKQTFIFLWKTYYRVKYRIKVLRYRIQIKLNKKKITKVLEAKENEILETKENVASLLSNRASGIKSTYNSINEIPYIKKIETGEVVWMNRFTRRKLKNKGR